MAYMELGAGSLKAPRSPQGIGLGLDLSTSKVLAVACKAIWVPHSWYARFSVVFLLDFFDSGDVFDIE